MKRGAAPALASHRPGHAHLHDLTHPAVQEHGVPTDTPPVGGGAAISVHDLTVAYRGHPAVHHLNGHFPTGVLSAVVGPNGAGKSSLLGVLGGTLRQFQGRVERDPALRLAYLPQASALDRSFPVQVQEVVAMGLWSRVGSLGGLRPADHQAVAQALDAVGLAGFGQRWLGELSAGQAQRVLFARVLMQDASLILLDEPFNAIDARTTADLLALLQRWKREARTVIAVLHDLDQVREHFDEALLLAREPVAWGPTETVLSPAHLARARQLAQVWDDDAPLCRAGA